MRPHRPTLAPSLRPSRPAHAADRAAIRETWAAHGRLCGVRVIFGFGGINDTLLQEELLAENALYGDLLQIDDIPDSYYNQTQLILRFFRWGVEHCSGARFMGKADEDTWINVFGIFGYLRLPEAGRSVTGWIVANEKMRKVNRPEDGLKWFLTKSEYPADTYPPYMMGYLYIFPADRIPDLLQAATRLPVHWIDDVFIAGQLPEMLQLNLLNVAEYSFSYKEVRSERCAGRNFFIIHGTDAEGKRNLFYHNCVKHLYMRLPAKCL
ncbi:beta-1,3-galactosyltransferase 5-like [Paramacrobiotus metropolitanus]|uniref:beta-1,3-galactosyltransferase 5-like n=1 Tax=Paramacrobiotus metropolitanus TaxID=2943436 RepID=UPI0024462638|nr:beta-1,3-galactosyltransferase 5-like [Paramacrobiotus metropolitanus]